MADHPADPNPVLQHLFDYLDSAHDAFFIIGEDMKLRLANSTLTHWMNEKEFVAGKSVLSSLINLSESIDLFVHKCEIAQAGTPSRFECLIRPPGSLPRWVEISLHRTPFRQAGVEIIGVARDISTHKNQIAKLKHQASHDELTGLINRREFKLKLGAMHMQAEKQHALLYLDLDKFKIVNDTCGHHAGDELLLRLAKLIRESLHSGHILARIGGDEFAILLEDCTLEHAQETAKAVRDTVAGFRFHWDGKQFDLGVSIGIARLKSSYEGTDCVISAADTACYIAKSKGSNQIHVYEDSECTFMQREVEWIARITEAFENNRFHLYYQNILPISAEYGCFDHREILLRLIDVDGRHIAPAEFVPAAEKFHLMPLIDRWVIRTLFARNAPLWRAAFKLLQNCDGMSMPLCCINLSGASLNDDYFPVFLRDQLSLYEIPPQSICFEITETVAINNLEKASDLIKELKTLGCRFSLDDFGSGMSSFSYLKSLPVDFLKIDGSLVKNIDHDKTDFCMVEAINKIAQEMGIKTIAEYVRNAGVIEKLQSIGVNFAQGYGIHQPEHLH